MVSNDSLRILDLDCPVQNYDWGLLGSDSLAGRVYQLNTGKPLSEGKPYAEVHQVRHILFIQLHTCSCGLGRTPMGRRRSMGSYSGMS